MTPTPNTGLKEAGVPECREGDHKFIPDGPPGSGAPPYCRICGIVRLSALPPVVEAPGDQEGVIERIEAIVRAHFGPGSITSGGAVSTPAGRRFAEEVSIRILGAGEGRPSPEPEPVRGAARSAVRAALEFYRDNWDWFFGDGEQPNAVDVGSPPTFYEAEPNAALKADEGKRATEALAALSEPVQELQGVGREDIARIIDPEAWEEYFLEDGRVDQEVASIFEDAYRESLAKADEILRALSSPEPGRSEFVRVPREPDDAILDGRARDVLLADRMTGSGHKRPKAAVLADIYRAFIQEASQGSVTATRSALPADTMRSEGGETP